MVSIPVTVLAITSAATASGDTGQALSYVITANFAIDHAVLVSGDNGIIDGSTLSLVDVSQPGSFIFVVEAFAVGRSIGVRKTVTLTLSGAAGLGQVQNVSAVGTSSSIITVSHDALTGATFYQAAVNGDTGRPRTLGVAKTIGVSMPGETYLVKLRGGDGSGNFGAWSTEVSVAVPDLVDPGPASVITPLRAHRVTDAACVQLKLNVAASSAPFYYYGNATGTLKDGTFAAGGWVKDHLEDLIDVGLKFIRSIPAGYNNANHMCAVIVRNLYSTYGVKLHATMNFNTFGTPTPTEVLAGIRNPAKGNYAEAIASFAGLNEPNDPSKVSIYPTNWKDEAIAQHIELDAAITAGGASYSGVEHHCFSPWGRLTADITDLLAHTDPSLRTWDADVAPLLSHTNLHYYTGSRPPTIAGAPTGVDEGGAALDEVSLDWTIDDYTRLSPTGTPLPLVITESGWGRFNLVGNNNYVSIETSCKYLLRMWLEALQRGIDLTVNFALFQTDLDYDWQEIDYSIAGGTCTFTRLRPYTVKLNMMTAFYDSGGTAESFTLTNLDFTLSADASAPNDYDQRIHHVLFQKSSGVWFLAVWYDKVSWERNTKVEQFGSRTVKLTLNGGAKVMRTNRPYDNTTWSQVNGGVATATTLLTVHDDPLIIEVTP